MSASGQIGPSVKLVDIPRDAGRGESLKAGAFVFAEVREKLGPELYRIAIGGKLYTASSALSLAEGQSLKARVERLPSGGEGLTLRLIERQSEEHSQRAAELLKSLGLPSDAAAQAALAALQREGLGPDPRSLSRVRRAILRGASDEGDRAELAARMEAKGLPADEASLAALSLAADGRSGGGYSGGKEGQSGAKGRGQSSAAGGQSSAAEGQSSAAEGQSSAVDLRHDFELAIPESDLPSVLASFLRELAMRTDDAAGLLASYNHRRGKEGSWILLPFRFELDTVAFAGSFRIQLPYARGGSGRMELRFVATATAGGRGEDHEWACDLDFGGSREASLMMRPPQGECGRRCVLRRDELTAALASLRCALIPDDGRCGDRNGSSDQAVAEIDLDA